MKKSQLYLFIITVLMCACTQQNPEKIREQISEIQQKNIADKRLKYWNVELRNEDNTSEIVGATVSEKAFSELKNIAEELSMGCNVQLLPTKEFKENPWGIVTLSVSNIRGDGRHSAELVTQALMGTPVKVYQKAGSWYLIQTPDRYFGWVDDAAIELKTSAQLMQWKALPKVIYKKQSGFAFAMADESSVIECDLVLADLLSIVGEENEYYKILMADGREAFVKKDECAELDIWKAKSLNVNDVLQTAFNFKGVPYLWGGTSAKMVDCSGFTKTAFYLHGVILQRDASQQTLYGEVVDTKNGYENLETGDLVFFGRKASENQQEKVTHVGLCTNNKEFIHASGKVRINSLDRNSENYTEYYETAFVRARRIVDNIDGTGIEWVVDNDFYKQVLPE